MSGARFKVLKTLTCTYVGEEQTGQYTFGGVHTDDVFIDLQSESRQPIKVVLIVRPLELSGDVMIALQAKDLRSLRRAQFDGAESGRPKVDKWERLVMHFEVPQRMVKPGTLKVLVGSDRDDLHEVHEFRIIDIGEISEFPENLFERDGEPPESEPQAKDS